jgi:hypothetical protein
VTATSARSLAWGSRFHLGARSYTDAGCSASWIPGSADEARWTQHAALVKMAGSGKRFLRRRNGFIHRGSRLETRIMRRSPRFDAGCAGKPR